MDRPVLLCGLGHVGFRVGTLLRRLDVPVTIVTKAGRPEWLRTIRELGARVLEGDARDPRLLAEAGLDEASALVVVTDHDVTNIEIAIDARARRPELPIVVRLFDQSLRELEGTLGLRRALAMSALAAPSFAAAAMGERVLASFPLGDRTWIAGRLPVERAGPLEGLGREALAARGAALIEGPDRPLAEGDAVTLLVPKGLWDELSGGYRPSAPARPGLRERAAEVLRHPGLALRDLARAASEAPLPLRVLGLTLGTLMVLSVFVFLVGLKLSFVDALYFLVTTVTTTGYGDINLLSAPWTLKLYGCFVMVLGSAAIATLYSMVTDFIVTARFKELLGKQRVPREGHVVVAGLGQLGYRIVNELRAVGLAVVTVDRQPSGEFVEAVRSDVPLVVGDARLPETLRLAGAARAAAILAVTGDDAANLGIAMAARKANPSVRTVVRLFDADVARKVQTALRLDAALSGSLLSAPTFAASALEDGVKAAFVSGDLLISLDERPAGAPRVEGETPLLREDRGSWLVDPARAGEGSRRLVARVRTLGRGPA